ncbi:MAG TPA: TauD/TfdA family dioxygenase [Pyrinomonadaceae bacterium]|nr:TauD/TfdA family dioxygenase [Pyrinomonadaceae bacterium]
MNEIIPRRRQAVRLTQQDLVRFEYLDGERGFPLVVRPGVADLNLSEWAGAHRGLVEGELLSHGAILFRGFRDVTAEHFSLFVGALTDELLDYRERAAPRSEVRPFIYTSTEYPADQRIPLHHEMSYSHNWPTKIWFFCGRPAQSGGRTPIADDRRVFGLLSPAIKKRFLEKGVLYVRNYGEGVDLPWQEVFQTDDRGAVERYCREAYMTCEWRSGDRLRTRAIRQVVATHPKLGVKVWFNHAHMFHASNLTPETREALLAQFAEDELPRNAFYGDGSPIEPEVAEEIRETYSRAAVAFDWQQGDILLLDNFLASHGREAFSGPREILVAMAELYALGAAQPGLHIL